MTFDEFLNNKYGTTKTSESSPTPSVSAPTTNTTQKARSFDEYLDNKYGGGKQQTSVFTDSNPFLGVLNPTNDIGEQKIATVTPVSTAPKQPTLPSNFLSAPSWGTKRSDAVTSAFTEGAIKLQEKKAEEERQARLASVPTLTEQRNKLDGEISELHLSRTGFKAYDDKIDAQITEKKAERDALTRQIADITGRTPEVISQDVNRTNTEAKKSFWDIFTSGLFGPDMYGQEAVDAGIKASEALQTYDDVAGVRQKANAEMREVAPAFRLSDEQKTEYTTRQETLLAELEKDVQRIESMNQQELLEFQAKLDEYNTISTALANNSMTGGQRIGAGASSALHGVGSALTNIFGQMAKNAIQQQYGNTVFPMAFGGADTRAIAEQQRAMIPEMQQATQDYWYGVSDRLAARQAELTAAAKQNATSGQQLMFDAVQNATEIAMDGIVNAISGGGGLAFMGTRVYGQASGEARRAGAGEAQQALYGLAKAGVEVLTEKMFDGFMGIYGKGVADDLATDLVIRLTNNPTTAKLLTIGFAGLGESIEEGVSSLVDPATEYIINGEKFTWKDFFNKYDDEWSKETGEAMLLGGLLGMFGGTTQVVGNAVLSSDGKALEIGSKEWKLAVMSEALRNQLEKAGFDLNEVENTIADAQREQIQKNVDLANMRASQIARDADARATFEEKYGKLPASHTEAEKIISRTLYQASRPAPTTTEQAPTTEAVAPATEEAQEEITPSPVNYTESQEQIVDMLLGNKRISYSDASKILSDPALKEAFQQLFPDIELPDNRNKAKEAIHSALLENIASEEQANAQLNNDNAVDNTEVPGYTNTNETTGVGENGTAESGMGGETGTGVSDVRTVDTQPRSEGQNGSAAPVLAGEYAVIPAETLQALDNSLKAKDPSKGIVNVGLQNSTDSAFYSTSLQAAKDADPSHGNYVSFKDAEEIQEIIDNGGKVLISQDGSTGVIVKADGDVVAVFRNQQTGKKGSLPEMLVAAVANGGTKLDCYGIDLVNNYAQAGFVPVARCVFNPEIAMEYDGWTQEQIDEYRAREGHDPDVIFMMHNGQTAQQVSENYGKSNGYTWEDLDALPTYEGETSYDDAQAYRDEQLAKRDSLANRVVNPEDDGPTKMRERGESKNVRTDESMAHQLRNFKEQNPDIYKVVTNKSLIRKALKIFNEQGLENSAATLERALAAAQDGKKLPLEMVPLHKLVCDELSRIGQVERANRISADLGAELTYAGELSQANAIFRNTSPTAKADAFAKTVNRLVAENNSNVSEEAINDLISRFRSATTDEARDAVIDDAMTAIAQSSPTTLTEALNAIRYLNMLGNFKTQIRNVFGNTGMLIAARIKNRVMAVEQYAANAWLDALGSDKSIEQTNTLTTNWGLFKEAWKIFPEYEKQTMNEGKYSDFLAKNKSIADKKTIFKWNWKSEADTQTEKAFRGIANAPMWVLEKYRNLTNFAMEEGDVIFQRVTFAQVLADYAKAQGYDSLSNIESETLEKMTARAVKEASEATFHDSNAVSDAVSTFDKNFGKIGKTITQGIMPFRRTPVNVGVRMEEYSPLGVINTVVKAIQASKGNADINDVLNSAAKTLSGSALAAAGYMMARAGLARGKNKDKELENYEKNVQGLSDYALTFQDGTTVSLDWFQPASASFFTGVAAWELFGDGVEAQDFLSLLGTTSDIALNMSFLSGLQTAAKGLSTFNGEMDAIPLFLLNSYLSYAGQIGTNSLVSQAVQTSQQYRQSYYSNNEDSIVPTDMQYNVAKILAKIPGTDYNRTDFIDAWGRKQDNGSVAARIGENFFSPAYINEGRITEVDDELKSVYEKTNEKAVLPKVASRSLKIDEKVLTPEEYETYQTTLGSASLELVSALIETDEYKNASADEKADMIKKMYGYAGQLAKAEVEDSRGDKVKISDTYDQYVDLEDPVEAMIQDIRWSDAIQNGDYNNEVIDSMIANISSLNEDTQEVFRKHNFVPGLEAAAALAEPILSKDFFDIHDFGTAQKKLDTSIKNGAEDTRDYDAIDDHVDFVTPLFTDDDGNIDKDVVDIFDSYYSHDDELIEAKQHGMDSKTWYTFYDEYTRINAMKTDDDGDVASSTFKHNKFMDFIEHSDVPDEQKEFIKEQMQFWTSRPVENTVYDKMTTNTTYNVNPDNAYRWTNEIANLEILDGNKSITGTQKAQVFWNDESVPVTERIEGMIAGNVQPKMHDFAVWLNGEMQKGNLTMSQINSYWAEAQRLEWWKRDFNYALKHDK